LSTVDHLALAKEDLAIAESADAKREAYKRAAEHIAAYQGETGESQTSIAMLIGRSQRTVSQILKWRDSGYEAQTPFLMDAKATDRAAVSHTKRILREHPEAVAEEIAEAMDKPEVREEVAERLSENPDERGALYAAIDRADEKKEKPPKPKPNVNASDLLERDFERVYFSLRAVIKSAQDIAIQNPEHMHQVADQIQGALDVIRGLIDSGMTDELEAWLASTEG